MTTFTFDTSGYVTVPPATVWYFDDLTPFAQGKTEAILRGPIEVAHRKFADAKSQAAYDLFRNGGWHRGDIERFYRQGFGNLMTPERGTPRGAVWRAGRDRALSGAPSGVPDSFKDFVEARAAFHMLAPATLSRINGDCERFQGSRHFNNTAEGALWLRGSNTWAWRNEGRYPDFPPLTVSLGEDGLIYLRARGAAAATPPTRIWTRQRETTT